LQNRSRNFFYFFFREEISFTSQVSLSSLKKLSLSWFFFK